MSKKKKKPYLANNWQGFKDTPDEFFAFPGGGLTYENFVEWKLEGWELPSSHVCIIRVTDSKTKKVTEYAYKKPSAAQARIKKLMKSAKEFVVVDEENIHQLSPSD